ncbi:MAG TPA: hypothetical protein VE994_17525 [Terriglobales bacterium]|nr:hypothetical protein [Terriglobales bacterium]
MNLTDILNIVVALDAERRTRWLIDLGWAMTVSARAGYPAAQQGVEPIPHLMAFNEMQHQLFNYLRHSRGDAEWKIEDFVKALCQQAKVSGIEGDFGWALKSCMERLTDR